MSAISWILVAVVFVVIGGAIYLVRKFNSTGFWLSPKPADPPPRQSNSKDGLDPNPDPPPPPSGGGPGEGDRNTGNPP